MSNSEGSFFSGGARPKTTTIGEGRKNKKKTDNFSLKEYSSKSQKLMSSFTCNNCGTLNQSEILDICDKCKKDKFWNARSSKLQPLWKKSYDDAQPSCYNIMSYDCANESDFSTSSVNLFRTKQPSLTHRLTLPTRSGDQFVTGSLLNLNLDTTVHSPQTATVCNGAANILHDEVDSTRTNDALLPQSSHGCSDSFNTEDKEYPTGTQALVKWKTAGLALRQILSKKSIKSHNHPGSLPPLHKSHEKADHTSCWLQRLRDFDEYDEEYFSSCTCDDTIKVTSHCLIDSEETSDGTCDMFDTICTEKQTILCHPQNNSRLNSKSVHSLKSECVSEPEKNDQHESLSNTICNSIVWEMLQKPYIMSSHGDNIDHYTHSINLSSPLSQNVCDMSACNNKNLYSVVGFDESQPDKTISAISDSSATNNLSSLVLQKSQVKHCVDDTSGKTDTIVAHSSLFESGEDSMIKKSVIKPNYLDVSLTKDRITYDNVCDRCCFSSVNYNTSSTKSFDKYSAKSPVDVILQGSDPIELYSPDSPEHISVDKESKNRGRNCMHHHQSCLSRPLLSSCASNNSSFICDCSEISAICVKNVSCNNYHHSQIMDISTSSIEPQSSKTLKDVNNSSKLKTHNLFESESEMTEESSICEETSDIYFSEGTDSSDLPSKLLRLNPTKNNTEYCAQSTHREKKKKVLHVRKCHRRSGSTSSDLDDDITLSTGEANNHIGPMYRNSFLLSEIIQPSTPLARFLKSHNPNNENRSSMPWENIEDGLSVESCADGDSNHSLNGMSEGGTLLSSCSLFKDEEHGCYGTQIQDQAQIQTKNTVRNTVSAISNEDRPSETLQKLLNMEIHTELKGDNSQYSPETWVRLVDQISLPFECADEDSSNDVSNDTTLVDSTEKSSEFADLCLPSYDDSSASCDADDEFECECEHCQLLKNIGNTEDIDTNQSNNTSLQDNSTYTWPEFLDDDNSLDFDLSELRPLEPLLSNLQDIPQDLIDLMFQNVIMQMLAVHPELMGEQAPPPVPQHIIDSLPTITTTQLQIDEEVNCPICLCPTQLEETLTKLSCHHLFHPLCIQAWLAKSGTCPVCRCTINGETS